jgi:PAS domain S-box-containing protein
VIVYESVRDAEGVLQDFRFTLVNPAAEQLLRRPAEELIGRKLVETYPHILSEGVFHKFAAIVESGATSEFEFCPQRGDPPRWYRIAGAKLGDGLAVSYVEISHRKESEAEIHKLNDELQKLVKVRTQLLGESENRNSDLQEEIRERRRKEEQLKSLTERLQLATVAARIGVWEWDVRTNLLTWDTNMHEIYGVPEGRQLDYQLWANAVVADDLPMAEANLQRVIAEKNRGSSEFRITRADGQVRHLYAAMGVTLDGAGVATRLVGVNVDITNRKAAEEALRENEERFQRAFNDAPIGMALVSKEGRWLRVNNALCAILGYSREELVQTNFQTITHPEDLHVDLGLVRKVLEGKIPSYHMEKRYLHKQGHIIQALLHVSLVRDGQGNPHYFVSQIEDITQRKQTEESLRLSQLILHEKNLELQTAAQTKDQFLANMSHELRTPLNGIIGFSELLVDGLPGPLNADQKEYLEDILNSSQHLLHLINDLLDLAKVGAGKMELYLETFSL